MEKLTQARLQQLLRYEPETGLFFWLVTHKNRKAGDLAGSPTVPATGTPYWTIKVDGTPAKGHSLAWLYMTGEWARGLIDHKDRNGINNKWDNLREATRSQNKANGKRYSSNSSGFKGVHLRLESGKYRARISVDNKRIHLGNFADPAAAHAAYMAAANKFFGEFARAG